MSEYEAYVAGVIKGDGYCHKYAIGLRVSDYEFAVAFAEALNQISARNVRPLMYAGYWDARTGNKSGKFNYLKDYDPDGQIEMAAWCRGFFDSEGNATISKLSTGYFHRRVAVYNTDTERLEQMRSYLTVLGVVTSMRATKNSDGHLGSKVVYELRLPHSKENFSRFATIIGSSIPRKQEALIRIVDTYFDDYPERLRAGQAKGAATRHTKMLEQTLPVVLEGIRALVRQGVKPTQANCSSLVGYHAVRNHFKHSEIVRQATEES